MPADLKTMDDIVSRPLPERQGPRPETTTTNPHSQLTQQPETVLSDALLERLAELEAVRFGPSNRAPRNTVGLHVEDGPVSGDPDAFMLDREFAHVHPVPDSSLHMVLPEPLRRAALDAGWAEPHPLAGEPTISKDIVLVFAPRDEGELDVVDRLVRAAWGYATGRIKGGGR